MRDLIDREELANVLTHGLGIILAVGGGSVLITLAALFSGAREVVAVAVFCTSLILLYTASTVYHAARQPAFKQRLKILDHCAIFLLIAGTYTPFTIAAMRGGWGWSLFGIIWGLAALGIVLKLFYTGQYRGLSTTVYIVMGWLVLVALVPLSQALTPVALFWLVTGGIVYTVGALVYHLHRLPYNHAIWHLFVLGGSICHFTAVTAQIMGSIG
jgi:hemolysin III